MTKLAFVVALLAAVPAWGKTGLPAAVIPECLGVNIHFTGPEQKQVDQIAEGGFRFIRMDYFWGGIEKEKGSYDFKAHDELLAALKKRDVRAIFILDYGHQFYDEGKSPYTEEGRQAFARFAGAAAEHLKGQGVLWEIWNEPNISIFWKPEPNVENYVKLARATYAAVKKADPKATVLAPALACWDFAYLESAFKLGLLESTDAVSVHPYGSITPEKATEYYATVRGLIAKYAPKRKDIPIVSGEWGYSAVGGMSVEMQGQFLARELLVNLMNRVPLSIWYDWRDDGPDPNEKEHHFGTVYADFKPKPAYVAMQTLSRELDGYTYAGRMELESEDDYLLLFEKRGDYRLAAWTTGEPHKVQISLDVHDADVVSIDGRRERAHTAYGGLKVELTGAVQYVEPLRKSARWAIEAGWRVDAKVAWEKGELVAWMRSRNAGADPFYGHGFGYGVGVEHDGIKSTVIYDYLVSHKNSRTVRQKWTQTLAGFDEPFVRWVELDTSACPIVEVMPPADDALLVRLSLPDSEGAPVLKGKLSIDSASGLTLTEKSEDVELKPGGAPMIARFRCSSRPTGIYSFGVLLENTSGKALVKLPVKRYAIVETFADGKAGEPVTKYVTETDGDAKIPGTAKLTYADAPPGGPLQCSARLDYDLGEGWKFVRVSARPMLPITGKPKTALVWARGVSQDAVAKLRFTDSDGQTFQTDYGSLDFGDWQCIDADLTDPRYSHWGGKNDGIVRYPISWDSLFLLDPKAAKAAGAVYLGPLMLCYD